MPQREKKIVAVVPTQFRYQSVVECEENEDHHVVRPSSWPPRRTGTMAGDPHLSLQCELCAGWVIVYKGHATGELRGVKVILPEGARAATPQKGGGV